MLEAVNNRFSASNLRLGIQEPNQAEGPGIRTNVEPRQANPSEAAHLPAEAYQEDTEMASSDEVHQTSGVGINQVMEPHKDLHIQEAQASTSHTTSETEPHQPQTLDILPAQNSEAPDVDMGSSNVSSLDEVSSTPGAVQAYVANTSNTQAAVDIEDGYYPTSLHIDSEISDTDSALGSDVQSSTISLRESLYESVMENGREYHKYKQGQYYLPNDDVEQDRLNLQHHLWTLTLDGKLHLAPIANPQRVLDIGTGTGLVSITFLCLDCFRFLDFAAMCFASCVSSSSDLDLRIKRLTNLL